MTTFPQPYPKFRALIPADPTSPAAGYHLKTYSAGTTTPLATYIDSTETAQNPVDITLDANGEASVWVKAGVGYKFVLETPAGATVWTIDGILLNDDYSRLRADLISTSSGKGDSLVTGLRSLNGATLFTIHDYNENRVIDVKTDFEAVGNGIADDTVAIQAAIDALGSFGGRVFFPRGNYLVSSALQINASGIELLGEGLTSTFITTNSNLINCIEVGSNIRRFSLKGFSLQAPVGGTANAGLQFDLTIGGAEHVITENAFNDFFYNVRTGDVWWNSTISECRCNRGAYGLYMFGSAGQCIQNRIIRVYCEQQTTIGMLFRAWQCSSIHGCNFGGVGFGGTPASSKALRFDLNSVGMSVIGCNFETFQAAASTGVVEVISGCQVEIDSCTWVSNTAAAATGYQLYQLNTAAVVASNLRMNTATNMRHVGISNTSKLTLLDDCITDIHHPAGSSSAAQVNSVGYPRIAHARASLDLSGAAQEFIILALGSASRAGRLTRIRLIYTEASSADAGVNIYLKSANGLQTFYSANSESSKAKYYELEPALGVTLISNSPMLVGTAGGKTGTGEILVVIEYILD